MRMIFKNPTFTDIPSLKNLWLEAFGDSEEFFMLFLKNGYHYKRCRVAVENGKIVAALYFFDCYIEDKKIAYIYGVATDKQERGKGYCRKLIVDTHEHLKENGYYGALLVPGSERLFSMYEKFGYKTATYVDKVTVSANIKPLSNIRKIEKDEYQRLRRAFLPQGAVLQENENLDYLSQFEDFYTDGNFLLAAHIKDNTLYAQEFLGDKELLPFIVSSLSAETGVFRTKGDSIPFSLYCPFYDNSPKPVWFGLAFD